MSPSFSWNNVQFFVFVLLHWNLIISTCVFLAQYSRFLKVWLLGKTWDRTIQDEELRLNFDKCKITSEV